MKAQFVSKMSSRFRALIPQSIEMQNLLKIMGSFFSISKGRSKAPWVSPSGKTIGGKHIKEKSKMVSSSLKKIFASAFSIPSRLFRSHPPNTLKFAILREGSSRPDFRRQRFVMLGKLCWAHVQYLEITMATNYTKVGG